MINVTIGPSLFCAENNLKGQVEQLEDDHR
jgi:hypothetical protein